VRLPGSASETFDGGVAARIAGPAIAAG
jgi:hypothetical protein